MRPTFFKGALVGGLGAGALLAATAALAGSGIGGIFNLGQTNTVDATSRLNGTAANAMLDVANSGTGANSNGIVGRSASALAPGLAGTNGSSGVGTKGLSASGSGVYGQSTSGPGARGVSSTGKGVFGTHSGSSGTEPGVRGETSSADAAAAGVSGTAPNGYGVSGVSGGTGVYGKSLGSDFTAWGVHGETTVGRGVYGSAGDGGKGVFGFSGTGEGVHAGTTTGVGLYADGSTGTGVWAQNFAGTALYGTVTNLNNTGYAVHGVNASPNGYAGYFDGNVQVNGNLGVSGTITAGVKDFKIDNPAAPKRSYLYHASVESNELLDLYSGNVTTDGQGFATVRLPSWFAALNKDFRYQLTPIGQLVLAAVVKPIAGNRFTIQTSKPHVQVSWQVTGVRHDAFARRHPLQVVVPK